MLKLLVGIASLAVGAVASSPFVRVPGGALIHKDCIFAVPSGHRIRETDVKPCPHKAPRLPADQMYNIDVHYTPSAEQMTHMNASWTVPALPAQRNDGQVVYFWPGFKSNAPTMGLPVLQPVLQYGTDSMGGGDYWCTRSWFVYGDQGIAFTSAELPCAQGDVVNSWMNFDNTAQLWTINAVNTNGGANTTLEIAASVVDSPFAVAMLVLETILNDDTQCQDLPASDSITFTGVQVNGRPIKWTDRITGSGCNQSISDHSSTVSFGWSSAPPLEIKL